MLSTNNMKLDKFGNLSSDKESWCSVLSFELEFLQGTKHYLSKITKQEQLFPLFSKKKMQNQGYHPMAFCYNYFHSKITVLITIEEIICKNIVLTSKTLTTSIFITLLKCLITLYLICQCSDLPFQQQMQIRHQKYGQIGIQLSD